MIFKFGVYINAFYRGNLRGNLSENVLPIVHFNIRFNSILRLTKVVQDYRQSRVHQANRNTVLEGSPLKKEFLANLSLRIRWYVVFFG